MRERERERGRESESEKQSQRGNFKQLTLQETPSHWMISQTWNSLDNLKQQF